jgi:hypothetical protein
MSRSRLGPEVFALPVDRLREGYYSDAYFNGAKRVLETKALHPRVTMQVFQKTDGAVLGGMDEALAMLRSSSGRFEGEGEARVWEDGWDQLDVRALYDGDELSAWETVLTIEGDYSLFAHLETVYLGVLSRRTLISTNVRRVVDAAHGKPILFFPARFDHYRVQTGDGYAAHVAGAIGVSTDAQASWWGGKGIGTVPHALIAAYGGDTVAAAAAFADVHYPEINVTALVDWDNDCVATSLACARALGERLWGVPAQRRGAGAGPRRAPRSGRRGLPARQHRRQRRLRRGAHPALRGSRRAGRRLRGRQHPAARQHGLHRRRRASRGAPVRQGRPPLPAQPASRACDLSGAPCEPRSREGLR